MCFTSTQFGLVRAQTDFTQAARHASLCPSEIFLIWDDQGSGQRSVHQRIYDYFALENNDPQVYPAPLQEEAGDWALQGQRNMDVVAGNLDGQGSYDVVTVWEGPNDSINVVVPDINTTTLAWSTAHRQRMDAPRISGRFDVALGDFDGDRRDEVVIAFVNDDDQIELVALDSDGTLIIAPVVSGELTGGTALTRGVAERLGRPCLVVCGDDDEAPAAIATWLAKRDIRILNVAGPRESGCPGIHDRAVKLLRGVLAG